MHVGVSRAMVAMAGCALLAGCGEPQVDNAAAASAIAASQTVEVTVQGRVVGLLSDGNGADGPHQRFRVAIGGSGVVVEVDHNLSLAPRVPVAVGDTVEMHGELAPDPGHPVIHYTHHATGRHEGGWIMLDGQTYS